MADYRIRVEPAADPFAIDPEACHAQRSTLATFQQVAITVVTFGLWLPGFLVWLATRRARIERLVAGYEIRVGGGRLSAGNAVESRTVPLDAIADISVRDAIATVSIRGAQPLQLLGLRDPRAAGGGILDGPGARPRGRRGGGRGGSGGGGGGGEVEEPGTAAETADAEARRARRR